MPCLGIDFFTFILVKLDWSRMIRFTSIANLGSCQPLFLWIVFSPTLSLFSSGTLVTYVLPLLLLYPRSLRLFFLFSSLFSLWSSDWIKPINSSLVSLTLSSAIPNLLLTRKLVILVIIFYIYLFHLVLFLWLLFLCWFFFICFKRICYCLLRHFYDSCFKICVRSF